MQTILQIKARSKTCKEKIEREMKIKEYEHTSELRFK
jgi:hypothetical protein